MSGKRNLDEHDLRAALKNMFRKRVLRPSAVIS